MKRGFHFLAGALMALAAIAAAQARANLSDGGHLGTVVDAADRRPIAGAKVVARWHVTWSGLATSGTRCVRVAVMDTDAEGRFYFPAWEAADTNVDGFWLEAYAYKAGYRIDKDGLVSAKPGLKVKVLGIGGSMAIPSGSLAVQMLRDTGTPTERGKYLLDQVSRSGCPEAKVGASDSYFVVKALYDEFLSLPADVREAQFGGGITKAEWLWRVLKDQRDRLVEEHPAQLERYPLPPSPLPQPSGPRSIVRENRGNTYPSAKP